jgi:hypothetical protein
MIKLATIPFRSCLLITAVAFASAFALSSSPAVAQDGTSSTRATAAAKPSQRVSTNTVAVNSVASKPVRAVAAQEGALKTGAPAASKQAFPYYIEFRSRSAQSYGHTFSIFGRLDSRGKMLTKEVAGLHPFTESPIPWMIGHLVLVPSETGASDGDTEDQYVTARFRVDLTEAEYVKLVAYIREHQAHSPVWHAVLYNCNAWIGDVARFMGMEAPLATLQYPEDYITELRDMNINRHSANMIGTPTKVEGANRLRAIALHQKLPPEKQAGGPATDSIAIQSTSKGSTNASW